MILAFVIKEKSAVSFKRRGFIVRAGFSLMELAIVMGIVGVIMSSIWAVTANVLENTKRETTFQQIVETVKGVRSVLLGSGGLSPTISDANLTKQLILQGAIPPELVPDRTAASPVAQNLWNRQGGTNGSYFVGADPSTPLRFRIALLNLPYGPCIALATRVSGDGGPSGLYGVRIDGGAIITNLPVSVGTAQTSCQKTSTGSLLTFYFALRAQ